MRPAATPGFPLNKWQARVLKYIYIYNIYMIYMYIYVCRNVYMCVYMYIYVCVYICLYVENILDCPAVHAPLYPTLNPMFPIFTMPQQACSFRACMHHV